MIHGIELRPILVGLVGGLALAACSTPADQQADVDASATGDAIGTTDGTFGGDSGLVTGARPDATNTGVPPGTNLTVVNGDVTITQDGTVIDAEDIHGFVTIAATNVTIRRSILRGGAAPTTNRPVLNVQSGTGTLLEDDEIAVANPSPHVDGAHVINATVRRLNIHGGVDGMKVDSNSIIQSNWVHDLSAFANDPNQGGNPSHNDCIQILEGTAMHVEGNNLQAIATNNSAIQVTQDFGAVSDLHIIGNWADGGGCTFNVAAKVLATLTGVTVTDNRFGRASTFHCPILENPGVTLVLSGNVYDDNDQPVPVQH